MRGIAPYQDNQCKAAIRKIWREGVETPGRTKTDRIRYIHGMEFEYDLTQSEMSAFTLRANNPNLPVAETMAFLMGANTVEQLIQAHPGLKLWEAWASKDGELGGVYGEAFHQQFPKIIQGLIDNPMSTHHRMTTLIPEKFPVSGDYSANVAAGKFSLMPCLHSYHFLYDGDYLHLHATQASGDTVIGVFPHNAYQVQFMLLLTSHLTGLQPGWVKHHIHDVHLYVNQEAQAEEMLNRKSKYEVCRVTFPNSLNLSDFTPNNIPNISKMVLLGSFDTHPKLTIPVDS